MEGFCNWSEACIEQLDIQPSLLEGCLGKVMQAMVNMYAFYIICLPKDSKKAKY